MTDATERGGGLVLSPDRDPLAVPTAEAWRAMTPAQRWASFDRS